MLSPKRRRFVAEYLKDQNAKQAAIRAGYSPKAAEVNGPRLLRNAQVKAAVEAKLAKVEEKCEISTEYVLRGLKEVAERCMQRVPVMEFDRTEKCMVQKKDDEGCGVWEFDSAGANRALELLGKYRQMFTDNVKHSGNVTLEQILGDSHK